MAKHSRHIQAAKTTNVQRLEHTEVFDDNLLPEAGEIQKLHSIDPNILDWLKQRAEGEQDFRHTAFDKRIKLVDDHNCREHNTARFALTVYFILVAGCLTACYFLLMAGKNTSGSVFGGAAVILALAVLITRRSPQKPSTEDGK